MAKHGTTDSPGAQGAAVVAHGFLWAAPAPVPELGLAVADAGHGRGLGRALIGALLAAARLQVSILPAPPSLRRPP